MLRKNWAVAIALLFTLGLSACGGDSDSIDEDSTGNNGGGFNSDDSGSSFNTAPGMSFSFNLTGPEGKKPKHTTGKIQTDSILKVRISAYSANLSQQGLTAFPVGVGCFRFKVSLGRIDEKGTFKASGAGAVTQILSAPGVSNSTCPGAPPEEVIDFSNQLSGPLDYAIRISEAAYDFYCHLWWTMGPGVMGPYNNNCPVRPVYKNHSVNGMLKVEINGSSD